MVKSAQNAQALVAYCARPSLSAFLNKMLVRELPDRFRQDFADRSFEPGVIVRDHELDAGQDPAVSSPEVSHASAELSAQYPNE